MVIFYCTLSKKERREKMSQIRGTIEVITGCMFSGKSEELLRRLRRAEIAHQKVGIFKPQRDTRSPGKIESRCGISSEAHEVMHPREIPELVKDFSVVGIDEIHFFDDSLFDVVCALQERGCWIIVSGLDMDFRGEPFMMIARFMGVAAKVSKLHAVCSQCHNLDARAMYSQKFVGGEIASYESALLKVGNAETYQARCHRCFMRPVSKSNGSSSLLVSVASASSL